MQNKEQSDLYKFVVKRIREEGPLSFADFMQIALYEPGLGYYTRQPNLIGARGDFYTAPHLSPVFGELVARQLVELWERLEKPSNFCLVEMGAGQGVLAGDVLTYIKQNAVELWSELSYTIIEISEYLIRGQRRRLQEVARSIAAEDLLEKVIWRSLDELPDGEVTGVFFSNELVDALPVHLVQFEQGQLREVFVEANPENELVEVSKPLSTPELSNYFDQQGIDLTGGKYPEGYRTEVNLMAKRWLTQVSAKLGRGYLLTIDYGYTAERYYSPARTNGTLQCYFNHTVNYDPYQNVGEQDITAHVNFSYLILVGEQTGWKTEGFTNQATFLAGLGIGEKIMQLSSPNAITKTGKNSNDLLTERSALMKLIIPSEMGNFGVLLQSKNVLQNPAPLLGFSLLV